MNRFSGRPTNLRQTFGARFPRNVDQKIFQNVLQNVTTIIWRCRRRNNPHLWGVIRLIADAAGAIAQTKAQTKTSRRHKEESWCYGITEVRCDMEGARRLTCSCCPSCAGISSGAKSAAMNLPVRSRERNWNSRNCAYFFASRSAFSFDHAASFSWIPFCSLNICELDANCAHNSRRIPFGSKK